MQVYFLFEYYSKGDLETSYPLIVGRFIKLPRATGHTIVPFERMNKSEQKKDKLRNQNMLNFTYFRFHHKISASVKKIHNSKVQAQCIVRIHLLTICVKKFLDGTQHKRFYLFEIVLGKILSQDVFLSYRSYSFANIHYRS